MTILDAYAVIAYLRGEPAADHVRPFLEQSDSDVTAVGLAEVIDHLVCIAGANEEDVVLDLAQLGLLDALPVDAPLGSSAGRLRSRYYHRARCPISMADSIAAETARCHDRPLATSDPDLLNVCHAEGIDLIALPGSDGSIWAAPTDT